MRASGGARYGWLVLVVALLASSFSLVWAQDEAPACEGDYLESVRETGLAYVEALNAGDLDPWYALLADGYQAYYPANNMMPLDKDAARASDEGLLVAFPGLNTEVHMSSVSADCRFVTYHWTTSGTFSGPLGDIPPNGNSGAVSGVNVAEVVNGQIVNEWSGWDQLSLLTQLGLLGAPPPAEEAAPSSEAANMDTLNLIAAEGLTAGDASVLEAWIAEDYVVHSPFGDLNRDAVRGFFDGLRAAMTDFTVGRENMVASGDSVAMRTILTGTFDNEYASPMGPIAPNGQPFYLEIINIFQFNDEGKIQEEWAQFDTASYMGQLGAMPAPAEAESTEAAATDTAGVMTEEEAAHFVERLTALFDGPNLDIADELFAPDTVVSLPLAPALDLEAWKAYVGSFYVGIPDLRDQVNQVIIGSDRLVLHSTYSGTHTGVLFGVPGTGNPVSLDGISIFRFNEAGLVVQAWSVIDVVGLLAQIGAFPPAPAGEGVLTEEEAAHFVEVFDSFFNNGPDLDAVDEIFAPEFVSHLPLAPELTLEAFKGYVASFYAGASDLKQTTNQIIIGEDRLILHVTYTGTHDGTLLGVPATGNPVSMNGIGIFRFNEDGLAVENWAVIDVGGVLAQIGGLPTPAE